MSHDNKARDELKEIRQLILKSVNSQMVDLDTLAADIDTYTQSRVEEAERATKIKTLKAILAQTSSRKIISKKKVASTISDLEKKL